VKSLPANATMLDRRGWLLAIGTIRIEAPVAARAFAGH